MHCKSIVRACFITGGGRLKTMVRKVFFDAYRTYTSQNTGMDAGTMFPAHVGTNDIIIQEILDSVASCTSCV